MSRGTFAATLFAVVWVATPVRGGDLANRIPSALRARGISEINQSALVDRKNAFLHTGDVIIPQIANGGSKDAGFMTLFEFTNISTVAATFEVLFFDGDGDSMSLPMVNDTGTDNVVGVADAIAPGGVKFAVTSPTGPVKTGYALVTSVPAGAVTVNTVFTQMVPKRPLFQAGIPLSSALHDRFFVPYLNADGFTGAIAVASLSTQMVEFIARGENGAERCRSTEMFQEGEHLSFVISDRLACTKNSSGVVEVRGETIGLAGVGVLAHDGGSMVTQTAFGPEASPSCATSFCFVMPVSGSLYIRVTRDDGGQWTFGRGTKPGDYQPIFSNTPSPPEKEVFIGTFAGGQIVHFGMFTTFGEFSGYAFSNGTDEPSRVAFVDTNNSLGRGGSAIEQTSPTTWIFHLDNSVSYLFDDDDNDIVMAVRVAP